jgi:hypothetical protein
VVKAFTDRRKHLKKLLSSLSGFGTSMLTDHPTFKLSLGVPVARGSVQVSRPRDRWRIKGTVHFMGQKSARGAPFDPWSDEL